MNDKINLVNHFLIAMPSLREPAFRQAVTYICEHNENGAIGVIINRPIGFNLEHIFKQIAIETVDEKMKDAQVLYGGPVQPKRGFIIHSPATEWRSTLMVSNEIAVTTSQDILEAMANGQGPERVVVALGYASWAPHQLEKEITENLWLSCLADASILFDTPFAKRWQAAGKLMGIGDINVLFGSAGHA